MDQVKLETKWPPDRKSTVIRGASEFGIYKEPADGKRLRATDSATGCLLVLSLIAAAAVVVSTLLTLTFYPQRTATKRWFRRTGKTGISVWSCRTENQTSANRFKNVFSRTWQNRIFYYTEPRTESLCSGIRVGPSNVLFFFLYRTGPILFELRTIY